MNIEIQNRIAKIYALAQSGATEGEKDAAKKALDRLVKKYNIDLSTLDLTIKKLYKFKYKMTIERHLIAQLIHFFKIEAIGYYHAYNIGITMNYSDYVELDCAYEYFRRDLVRKWKKHCTPIVSRCRTIKTKKLKIEELMPLFFSKYIIASGIYHQEDLASSHMTSKKQSLHDSIGNVEGGKYNKQIISNKLLEQ